MENVRKRRKVDLVCSPIKLKKLLATPQLKQFLIVNKETVLMDRIRAQVTLNKPIYIGFTVLDVSKLLMFDFHYNVMARMHDCCLPIQTVCVIIWSRMTFITT